MRLFVAFKVDGERLMEIQKNFEIEGLKLVKDFHCTLKFLGEVDDEEVENVRGKLRGVRGDKFEAEVVGVGAFPSENYARVIWVGLEPEEKIKKLQQKVDESLRGMFEKEEDFKAHVTIARVKFVKDKKLLRERLGIKIARFKFKVNELILFKSELRRDGPVYGEIERYGLG